MHSAKTYYLLIASCLLFSKASLVAQRCILYTQKGDTVIGKLQIKTLKPAAFAEAQGKPVIDRIDLQQGLTLIKPDKSEQFYRPSELKEALLFLSKTDTVRLVAFLKSDFFPAILSTPPPLLDYDTHALVESNLEKGPLVWCRYYLETKEEREVSYNNAFRYIQSQTHTELIRLDGKWTELPDERNFKSDMLSQLLADCPRLVEKIKRNKINVLRKMPLVVSDYNHCSSK